MSVTGKERREVPLPSQEGKKGVMQYALYVASSIHILGPSFREKRVWESIGMPQDWVC
jgi:hypothetical protein